MPTSTRSGATDRSPQDSDGNALATRTRGGTAKIIRTRQVIDRVTVEHVGTPPVTTTAEQQVIKTTTMERGKRNSDQALESPRSQEAGSKRRQTTSSVNNGSANGDQAAAPSVEVPVEEQDPMGQEQDTGAGGEEQPFMSTQDYMTEAEELLAIPMDTQGTQELGGGEEAAPEAAGGTEDFDTPLQTEAPAEAAGQETASAAQEHEGEDAAAVTEELGGEGAAAPTAAVPVVAIVEDTVVAVVAPVVEEPEEDAPEAEGHEEAGAATATPPTSSSGGRGLLGSVAQVIQGILHPGARTSNGHGNGAREAHEEEAEMQIESAEPGAAEEQPAAEELAAPRARRGRPPAKAKQAKGAPKTPATPQQPGAEELPEAGLPTRAVPSVAAVSPDGAGEPPEPEAVAKALPERKGRGPAKKAGKKGTSQEAAPEKEGGSEEAAGEAAAPQKKKGAGRLAKKKQQPAQEPEAEEEQEEGGTEKDATPVRIIPPQTKLDVQAPRTPSKPSKHPSKPSTEPATKRARGEAKEYTVEEPEEEEEQDEEEEQEEVRVSPRRKPQAAAAEPEPERASARGRAPAAAPKPAPSKAAAAKPKPEKSATAAKAAPAKGPPGKAAPAKSPPAPPKKASAKAAPVEKEAAKGKQTPAGRKPAAKSVPSARKSAPKTATRVTKPRKSRHESYKSYIFKVLKEIHPDESISQKAMAIMDTFAEDMFNRITAEAARLCRHTNKQTMSSREIETAVKLLLPGELGKHALSEGRKAVVSGLS